MRIASWNINSVRLRIDLVREFVTEYAVDVLCLQETKCVDDDFPHAAFEAMGLTHRHIRGEKSYNGVAILSRVPLKKKSHELWAGKDDTRHVSAVLPNGIEIHNFYIPAGGDEPDVKTNPKFAHKLKFVDEMGNWFEKNRKKSDKMILVGDLNIAFTPNDVWNHKQLLKIVSYTEIEREKLNAAFDKIAWQDAVRSMHEADEALYSWWSYRAKDWQAANRGRRLDHIWVTAPVAKKLQACSIVTHYRGKEKPSDHVPVFIDL